MLALDDNDDDEKCTKQDLGERTGWLSQEMSKNGPMPGSLPQPAEMSACEGQLHEEGRIKLT